jgi:hypothetical protein
MQLWQYEPSSDTVGREALPDARAVLISELQQMSALLLQPKVSMWLQQLVWCS